MSIDPISRVRRFNRAITSEVGALDTSFLGRGRPLGAARVLNAIGHGRSDIADIRAYLGLDSGLMSRLLRTLEDDGLITTAPHPNDTRRRIARLTETGHAEFGAYESLSDEQAKRMLATSPRTEALLAAMDLIATSLGHRNIALIETDPKNANALYCLGEYYAELARRLDKGFDVSLSRDPEATDMTAPRGAFFVAMSDGLPLGCIGLKGSGGPIAEIKRLWVAPAARGLGLAKRLLAATEERARALSIKTLRLDTNSALPEAKRLYERTGWHAIPRFNDDPYPDLFFEKEL